MSQSVIVNSVLSGVIRGVGYENGTLRIVFKNNKAYDYLNVSLEDYTLFMRDLGKALSVIKSKYRCLPVTDTIYFSK